MGCSDGLAMIVVFVANFCCLVVGLGMLVVGTLHKIDYNKYNDAIPDQYQVIQLIATLAITFGAVIFVISFLGCCGIFMTNGCVLFLNGVLLIIILILQVGLGSFALDSVQNHDELRKAVKPQIDNLFDKYGTDDDSMETVNAIQRTLICCGTTGPDYWILNGEAIPASCPSDPFVQGCQVAMYNFLLSSVKMIGIIALSVSAIEVTGAVLAIGLACFIGG